MSFKEEVAKLEAKVENTEIEHSTKVANTVFSREAQKEIEVLARGLGMPQALPTDYMFEMVKTKRGSTFLAAPSIIGKEDFLTVKWHTHEFQFKKSEEYEYEIEVKEEGYPGITLFVSHVNMETETEVSYGFRFRLEAGVKLPTAGVLKRQFKMNPHSLAKYCRNETPINSLKEAPAIFNITGVRTIQTGEGKTVYVLDTDAGSFWGTEQCAELEVPARAAVEEQEVWIEQSAGVVKISFSSFGKLRELEIGEYKVKDYKRRTSDTFGEQINILLDDGKWYSANSTITKVINAFELPVEAENYAPIITEENPATLKIQDKKPMKNGNIKVICQFMLGEQKDDDFDKSFNSWLEQQAAPIPF